MEMDARYIRASELRTFLFCERAWFLERRGKPSTLQSERIFGTTDHDGQNEIIHHVYKTKRSASWLLAFGFAGAVLALGLLVIFR